MKKINWGIVGAGRISTLFVQDMQYVDNGQVLAVAARNLDNAKTFANKFAINKAYGSYDALFQDPEIDIVYIGTPHNFHFEQAKAAILAGKHVLCEKPMTVSSAECEQLTQLAKANNVYLMEAMWTYFLPAIIQAKKWVDEGKIGQLKHVKADFGYPMPYNPEGREYNPDLAGGCLFDMGIYPIAIANYFLGNDIKSMFVSADFAPTGVDNDVSMFAEFATGKANLATSFQCKLNNNAYIIGDKGYIVLPDFWQAKSCSRYELDEEVERFEDQRQSLGFNFEAQAAGQDLLDNKLKPSVVTHQQSYLFQKHIELVRRQF
ncbi:oxidoreductase-like protein [Catenovulum agarivorans DS-2]|uniref:Oxidoreductase-like protein n=1 Tax=Catenovulum agarivorans DS-2 TaxID=1328313 RepID=W7QPE8_9ALTE|nr:Gfo/Idh/MocA family oxidoreductase [Catenovulum agarivorans]EWH09768.1 oxidoreductase-like protein [Catenovulum agarivorans DS-2]